LSAKFALGGEEANRVLGRPLLADDDGWVVVGAGESYESRVVKGHLVRSVALFFDADLVATVRGERLLNADASLERTGKPVGDPLVLGRRRLSFDPSLARLVSEAAAAPEDDGVHVEVFYVALERVLDYSARVPKEWERLGYVRAATRAEIYRRLARVHDLIDSAYADPLTLGDLAREAAMAPTHFLARFRELFGITPHQALVTRRLARARWLLATSDEPIGSVARAVGFAGSRSFSARFARAFRTSPRMYRKAAHNT
jgi:AraC-like DNA-binding protein